MRVTGVGMALVAAVLLGASTPLAKGLLQDTSPQLLAGLLYLGSGAGLLLVWLGQRGGTPREAAIRRRDVPWLAGAIASGGVLGPLLLMYSLLQAPVSSASLLLNLEGVFSSLIAWAVFREHAPLRIALDMVVIVAGGARRRPAEADRPSFRKSPARSTRDLLLWWSIGPCRPVQAGQC